MSGYFKEVWKKNLPGETVFWIIVISLMRNFRRAVYGGHSFRWLLGIIVKCEVFIMMILTGPLLLSMSGYFRDVWRKNLPGETVFWNIVISCMRNFRRAVLGGWFIQVIPCNQSQIWGFHDVDSDELLHLSTSGYFRDVWRKNLPLEKVFWNIVISLMRNSQSDVLGGWFIHLIGCNQIRMWCFHDNDSYRVLILSMSGYFRMSGETIYQAKQFFESS